MLSVSGIIGSSGNVGKCMANLSIIYELNVFNSPLNEVVLKVKIL